MDQLLLKMERDSLEMRKRLNLPPVTTQRTPLFKYVYSSSDDADDEDEQKDDCSNQKLIAKDGSST